MSDLNVMMREHARAGLQTQLNAAVTNGDIEAANKITADIEKLAVSTAPKAPPYGDVEIKAALETKADWFGIDPRKSGAALRLGKDMNPKKFATAEAFADALIKAVEEEFKPAGRAAPKDEGAEGEEGEGEGTGEGEEDDAAKAAAAARKPRRTDGPGENDGGVRSGARRTGPWTKLSDAPPETQTEIKRTADKFAPKTEKGREGFIAKALEAHYAQAQRAKGKK